MNQLSPDQLVRIAKGLHDQYRFAEALDAIETSVMLDPTLEALWTLANEQITLKRYQSVNLTLRRLEDAGADPASIHFLRGSIFSMLDDLPAALEEFAAIRQGWINVSLVRLEAAVLWTMLGKLDRAQAELERVRSTSVPRSEIYYVEAIILSKRKLYGESNDILDKILSADPTDFAAVSASANNLVQMRRFEEARQLLLSVTRTRPEFANAWEALGWINVRLRRFRNAEDAFKRVVDLEPEDPGGYLGLRAVYIRNLRFGKLWKAAEKMAECFAARKEVAGALRSSR